MARFRYWLDGDQLLRYDSELVGFPRGAVLHSDGHWRPSECPDRNVWRGSDYGDEVSADAAAAFVTDHGFDLGVLASQELRPVSHWPQALTVMTVMLTRDSVAMGDDTYAPHEWSFPVNTITTLAELIEIIYSEPYLQGASTGPSTWYVQTPKPHPRPLAVLTRQRDRERWLTNPDQYVIQMPDVYDAATEQARLHVRHPFDNDAGRVFADLRRRLCTAIPAYRAHPNPAQRTQPARPRPPW